LLSSFELTVDQLSQLRLFNGVSDHLFWLSSVELRVDQQTHLRLNSHKATNQPTNQPISQAINQSNQIALKTK